MQRRLDIDIDADPQALSRVLDRFAIHGLTPRRLTATSDEALMRIRIEFDAADGQGVATLCHRLEDLPTVRRLACGKR